MISSLRRRNLFVASGMIFLVLGCTRNESKTPQAEPTMNADESPETTYRQFLLATLNPDETTICKLILDRNGADILWTKGSYPAEVAALLADQYREMTIERSETSAKPTDPNRVLLTSSAVPFPLAVVKVGDSWKVDASPIIAFRKKADEIRKQRESKK